jgi:high-affinity nickel-transport protein
MRLWVIAMPIDWLALCATVFALGLRHGLDADHLVAIDGMTRFSHEARRPLAPWCGALFSMGHGAIVILVATTAGVAIRIDTLPVWATVCGEWASIGVLLALGIINLVQVMREPPGHPLAPVGIQGRLLSRLTRTANPLGVAIVGASFALSFDTLSQALLFATTAARFQGWQSALILGGLFTAGMLLLDGLNGVWMAKLLSRADESGKAISRAVAALVAVLSLLVAAAGAIRLLFPQWSGAFESPSGFLGIALFAVVCFFVIVLAVTESTESVPAPCAEHRGVQRNRVRVTPRSAA